jgi:hypothetical protein
VACDNKYKKKKATEGGEEVDKTSGLLFFPSGLFRFDEKKELTMPYAILSDE